MKVIALAVGDVESAIRETKRRGATVLQPAATMEDEHGKVVMGTIQYAGDTVFRFVDRQNYRGAFAGIQANSRARRDVGGLRGH